VKLHTLRGVNIALYFTRHHDTVCGHVPGDFAAGTNSDSDFAFFGGLNISHHFAVNAHTVNQYQAAVNFGGAPDQCFKALL
jgi:hypothetical protein